MNSETNFSDDELDRAILLIQQADPPADGFHAAIKGFQLPHRGPRANMKRVGLILASVAAVVFAIVTWVEQIRSDRELAASRGTPSNNPVPILPTDSTLENELPSKISVTDQAKKVVSFVSQNCVSCHGTESYEGGIVLERFNDAASIREDRALWETALIMVQQETMPPPNEGIELAKRDRDEFLHAAEFVLNWVDPDYPNSGYVTMRRLNRAEYCNTVYDMLKVHFQPSTDFPPDEVRWGFDNNGEMLSLSPLLQEQYLAASESIMNEAFPQNGQSEFQKTILAHKTGNDLRGAAREAVLSIASRAFRRPATSDEVDRCLKHYDAAAAEGLAWEQALRPALQELLVSPMFLYRIDLDNRSDSAQMHPINEYQLASRLSYFLWSTSPDAELLELASKGELSRNLESQVRRMLKSDNRALVENFAIQWLKLRKPIYLAVDRQKFPEYTDELRESMIGETLSFFDEIKSKDRSILDLIDGKFTYLNEALAKYYGIVDTKGNEEGQIEKSPNGAAIEGDDFVRVELQSKYRSGVLTHASVLTASSYPGRTSPVNRGRFVLDRFLNLPTPPPPPPPVKVPPLEDQGVTTGSIRDLMDRHAEDPFCAACHTKMDAIGFALENFDALGRFRTRDGGFEIDASGRMPNGRTLNGPDDVKQMLREQSDVFAAAFAEKLLVYSLGRRVQYYDKPAVKKIVNAVAADGYKFSTLIVEIVKSDPFRMRRGKEPYDGTDQGGQPNH